MISGLEERDSVIWGITKGKGYLGDYTIPHAEYAAHLSKSRLPSSKDFLSK